MPSSTVSLLKRTYCEWSNHNSMRLAAAMAFYTMMSLAPLLVIALTILSFIYSGDVAQQNIKDRATLMLGSQGGDAVGQMLAAMTKHASHGIVATIVSFVVALVSGSSLFVNMQDAMNTIWDVKPRSNVSWKALIWPRLLSVVALFGAGAVLLASLVVSTALTVIIRHLPTWLSWASVVGEILISVLVIGLLFAAVYKILPNVQVQWKDVWIGAALGAALFVAGKYGLALYFRFASTKPYGAAGSLAAALIWVYYSSAIIFFGAAFTRAYAERNGKRVPPDKFGAKFMTENQSDCQNGNSLGDGGADKVTS